MSDTDLTWTATDLANAEAQAEVTRLRARLTDAETAKAAAGQAPSRPPPSGVARRLGAATRRPRPPAPPARRSRNLGTRPTTRPRTTLRPPPPQPTDSPRPTAGTGAPGAQTPGTSRGPSATQSGQGGTARLRLATPPRTRGIFEKFRNR